MTHFCSLLFEDNNISAKNENFDRLKYFLRQNFGGLTNSRMNFLEYYIRRLSKTFDLWRYFLKKINLFAVAATFLIYQIR